MALGGLAALGSIAGGVSSGLDAGTLRLQRQREAQQAELQQKAEALAGQGLVGGLNGLSQSPAPQGMAPGQGSQPMQQPPQMMGQGMRPSAPQGGGVAMPSADAISKMESGGRYDAIGPVNPRNGDKPYGKYQVMGANIPQWTKEALGQSMSPQEFLANPKAQDAVFQHRFGQYRQQYGNDADAASMWHSGKPLAQAQGRADVLGTKTPDYVNRFSQMTGQGGGAPQQGGQPQPGTMTLQSLVQSIRQANPNAPPELIFKAVQNLTPLLREQDQQQLAQIRQQMQQQGLDLRERMGQMNDTRQRDLSADRIGAQGDRQDKALGQKADQFDRKEDRLAERSAKLLELSKQKVETARQAALNAKDRTEFNQAQKRYENARKEAEDAQREADKAFDEQIKVQSSTMSDEDKKTLGDKATSGAIGAGAAVKETKGRQAAAREKVDGPRHEDANPSPDKPDQPPMAGARKAPDGKWYVQKDGKYFMVQ